MIGTRGADPSAIRTLGIAHMSAYGVTKAAALNAATKWAIKLKDEGFVVVSLSPGIVDVTDTFGESGEYRYTVSLVQAPHDHVRG